MCVRASEEALVRVHAPVRMRRGTLGSTSRAPTLSVPLTGALTVPSSIYALEVPSVLFYSSQPVMAPNAL